MIDHLGLIRPLEYSLPNQFAVFIVPPHNRAHHELQNLLIRHAILPPPGGRHDSSPRRCAPKPGSSPARLRASRPLRSRLPLPPRLAPLVHDTTSRASAGKRLWGWSRPLAAGAGERSPASAPGPRVDLGPKMGFHLVHGARNEIPEVSMAFEFLLFPIQYHPALFP